MGKVTTPFYLVVFRREDGPGGDASIASHPMEAGDHQTALEWALKEGNPFRAQLDAYTWDDDSDHFEVYKIGSSQDKSPEVYSPSALRRRGLLGDSAADA